MDEKRDFFFKIADNYNNTIWEEQKKQIEAKRLINSGKKGEDREFFERIGHKSSDVYYINEDKKKAFQAGLKGNAGVMAQNLRVKHNAQYQERLARREEEA